MNSKFVYFQYEKDGHIRSDRFKVKNNAERRKGEAVGFLIHATGASNVKEIDPQRHIALKGLKYAETCKN